MGQSQILDTHTSLLNVDDICSIKIVKQLIMGGIIKKGPKSADRGYWFLSPVLYGGEERGCFVTAPFLRRGFYNKSISKSYQNNNVMQS